MKRILLINLACLLLVSFSRGEDVKKYSITIGYLPATHDSLLFIAVHEKLFPANLSVQLRKYSSSPDILNDLAGGRVDVAIPGIAAPIQRIAEGSPFKIVGGAAEESAAVVVRPELKSKFFANDQLLPKEARIHAFANMKIGSVKLSTGDALFRCALRDNNVTAAINDSYHNPKDVLMDLKGGRLDAAVLWSPHMTTAENDGMPIVFSLGEVLPKHVCCRQVVREEYLIDQREAVVLYLTGLIKARSLYDVAQKSDDAKSRIIASVAEFVLNQRPVIEKELFGPDPRTKLSIDLNETGITDYLHKMEQEKMVTSEQVVDVQKSVESDLLREAYRRLNLSEQEADRAVKSGFSTVADALRASQTP